MYFNFGTLGHASVLFTLLLVGATALTLVPSPLIEFRYNIIPFYIWRLEQRQIGAGYLMLELFIGTSVGVGAMWIFLMRPFEWPGVEGFQRFMF